MTLDQELAPAFVRGLNVYLRWRYQGPVARTYNFLNSTGRTIKNSMLFSNGISMNAQRKNTGITLGWMLHNKMYGTIILQLWLMYVQ